jgi:hypothetical protein
MPCYRPNGKAFLCNRELGGGAMIDRALLVIVIMGMALDHAAAQFGGAPGTLPDASPVPSPAPRPPQCDALLAIRDEWQKHGQAIKAANQKKADVRGACKLFRAYLNTEMKMLRMLEADGASCGVPPSGPPASPWQPRQGAANRPTDLRCSPAVAVLVSSR